MGNRTGDNSSLPELTDKQREVLALVADNRTSKEIASRLGISESAVNQRIEIVRARLGGLPRGELARLYRQEYAPKTPEIDLDLPTWQKIQLPPESAIGNGAAAEGVSINVPVGSHLGQASDREGSQLSALFYHGEQGWLGTESRAIALARMLAMVAILVAGMVIAAALTNLVGTSLPAG